MNKYLIDIMVNEGVINNQKAILKTPRIIPDQIHSSRIDDKKLEEKIKELVNEETRKEFDKIYTRLENNEKAHLCLAENVAKMDAKFELATKELKDELTKMDNRLASNLNKINTTHKENHAETKDQLNLIIRMMRAGQCIGFNETINL